MLLVLVVFIMIVIADLILERVNFVCSPLRLFSHSYRQIFIHTWCRFLVTLFLFHFIHLWAKIKANTFIYLQKLRNNFSVLFCFRCFH